MDIHQLQQGQLVTGGAVDSTVNRERKRVRRLWWLTAALALPLAWVWYRELYLEEMRASYRRNHAAWRALLGRGRVVLCCWCGTAHRCHRRPLAEVLVLIGKRIGIEVVDGGEMGAGW